MNLKVSIRNYEQDTVVQFILDTNISLQRITFLQNCNYTNGNDDTSDLDILNDLRCKNLNRILIVHLNMNSLRNKFEILMSSIAVKIDILMTCETKLDESFPVSQFLIPCF